MKKTIFFLYVTLIIFAMSGCADISKEIASETETLQGYIVINEDGTLSFDEVEIIRLDNKERMAELNLKETDLPNGYYIYDPDTNKKEYVLTDETVYTFVDSNLLFVNEENSNRKYETTNKNEFIQHLNTCFSDSPPAQTIPFIIQVKDGKAISITEEFEFTI